VKLQSVEIVH